MHAKTSRHDQQDQFMLGRCGEAAAAAWYEDLGYEIVQLRYLAKGGEIDVIARAPDGTVVFAEVKTRRGRSFGAAEAVTATKLRRIRTAAAQWLDVQDGGYSPVRFDVIEVIYDGVNVSTRMYQGVDDAAC